MSFLLDALRKSEKQRRLGDVPNIHSADEPESRVSGNPGRKAVLFLLLVVFGLLAWFGWRQVAPPQEAVVRQRGTQVEPGIIADQTGAVDATRVLPEIPVSPGTDNVQKPDRTAVERYAGPGISGSAGHPERANADNNPLAAGNGSEPGKSGNVQVPSEDVQQNDGRAFRPGVISYWQLPESIRQQLQTFRISVIVFAKKPQDRFILLNGVRLIEGDTPEADLVLEEIRRGGAVFSYRHYRFLVTQ